MNQSAAEQIIHAFVTSLLDNGNALLYVLPQNQLSHLQHIQNTAARVVTLSRKSCHITPILKELHWLPVSQRIVFNSSQIYYTEENHFVLLIKTTFSKTENAVCMPLSHINIFIALFFEFWVHLERVVVSCRQLSSVVVSCRQLSSVVVSCRQLSSAVVSCRQLSAFSRTATSAVAEPEKGLYFRRYPYRIYNKLGMVSF